MSETETVSTREGHRKVREGEVVSTKMDKTIVVKISRRIAHPLYKKIITSYNKFHAHDENNKAQVGDLVEIMETRPLSKTKRWRLVRIVKRGELAMAVEKEVPTA
ncbi:MAG TPA: 30S ribosomal protein S17 [Verrucomicrobiota bacterium]|jgi:small subunit ribosomal protein S17|nr:30S ribosomal protein S17 [Verrucomicrobiota bacterium]